MFLQTLIHQTDNCSTSPSIYVALQTISATDLCGKVGSQITTGTTIAYNPGELSTAVAYSQNSTAWSFDARYFTPTFVKAAFGK